MTWADHFNTYTEACEFYGADTPESIEIEMECRFIEETIAEQDDIEARGGPRYYFFDNTIPF